MKKMIQAPCCALGGIMIGFFANRLDTAVGCICFTLGIILLVIATAAMLKQEK